jgi:hypothetical protein
VGRILVAEFARIWAFEQCLQSLATSATTAIVRMRSRVREPQDLVLQHAIATRLTFSSSPFPLFSYVSPSSSFLQ